MPAMEPNRALMPKTMPISAIPVSIRPNTMFRIPRIAGPVSAPSGQERRSELRMPAVRPSQQQLRFTADRASKAPDLDCCSRAEFESKAFALMKVSAPGLSNEEGDCDDPIKEFDVM